MNCKTAMKGEYIKSMPLTSHGVLMSDIDINDRQIQTHIEFGLTTLNHSSSTMPSFKSTILAILAAAPIAFTSPVPQEPKNATEISIMSAPRDIKGPWWNFPAMDTWKTFDQLVSRYQLVLILAT